MSYKSKYIFIYHLGHILKCKKASQIAAYGQFNSLDTLIFLLLVRTTIRIQMSSSNYQRIPRTRWSVLSAMPSVSYLIHEYLRAPGHQCDSFLQCGKNDTNWSLYYMQIDMNFFLKFFFKRFNKQSCFPKYQNFLEWFHASGITGLNSFLLVEKIIPIMEEFTIELIETWNFTADVLILSFWWIKLKLLFSWPPCKKWSH